MSAPRVGLILASLPSFCRKLSYYFTPNFLFFVSEYLILFLHTCYPHFLALNSL